MKLPLQPGELFQTIQASPLKDNIVCLHSSLKSFGFLEGGPDTLIQAFLQNGCTLVMPTFTYDCEIPMPPDRLILQNSYAPEDISDFKSAAGYDKTSTMISSEMGAIPAWLLKMPARIRGEHPLNSFTAIGPLASEIISAQSPLNVYGPLKVIYSRPNAYLVLAGVDLTSATPIHFAEERAGRRLFRRWAKNSDGSAQEVEVGSCSDGFNNLDSFLKNIEENMQFGQSCWKIYPFCTFIDTVTDAILQNPPITHCANPDCERCNDAIKGGPLL